MSEIKSTVNYGMFKKHENNRKIEKSNLARIKFSIQTNNMLQFRPILVDSQMRVVDGQHRLEAAKELGHPIYYQVQQVDSDEDIILLNANQKRWDANNYIDYHASKGKKSYIDLRNFCNKRNISPAFLVKFISLNSGRIWQSLKRGTWTLEEGHLNDADQALLKIEEVQNCIRRFLVSDCGFITKKKFVEAVRALTLVDGFDMAVFLSKLTTKAQAIKPCASASDYYSMLRDIYNWRNQNPIE